MDEKSLQILEYPKILERLAGYCAFPASKEKAYALKPTNEILEARQRQTQTREGVQLLITHPDLMGYYLQMSCWKSSIRW